MIVGIKRSLKQNVKCKRLNEKKKNMRTCIVEGKLYPIDMEDEYDNLPIALLEIQGFSREMKFSSNFTV